ncbi:hypothetical protein Hanom_Chr05g00464531 [Helianthus anomalus]
MIPVLAVIQAHLFRPGEPSAEASKQPSLSTPTLLTFPPLEPLSHFPIFAPIFKSFSPVFKPPDCFPRTGVTLLLLILPTDTRLCDESDEASDEHDAFIGKFDLNTLQSLGLKIGTGVIDLESLRLKLTATVTGDGDFLTSTGFPTGLQPVLSFTTGLRNSATDLVLLPAGPNTGRDSDSETSQSVTEFTGESDIQHTQ